VSTSLSVHSEMNHTVLFANYTILASTLLGDLLHERVERVNLRPPLTGKMFVWSPAFLTEPGSARYSSAPSITTVWSNYQTSHNDFFEVYITETVSYHLIFKRSTISKQCHVTSWNSIIIIHKYVIFRRQLMDLSKINNGWSLAVIVFQRKAIMQQIGLPISASN